MAITDEIPKSRLTLTYRTDVLGEKEDVALPFRLLVMGDLSNGTSKDRKSDLDARQIRNLDGTNLNAVIGDMDMSVSFSVDNKIDPDKAESTEITVPINSMKSFTPAEVANSIPKVKALLLLKKLLLEVQGNLDNRKEFRKLLRALSSDDAAVKKLMGELKGFENFKVPDAPAAGNGANEEAAAEEPPKKKKK
jgi:type VI secretion system protein ImpB